MKILKILAFAALAVAPAAAFAQVPPSGNPGIVVAGTVNDTSIPQEAKNFISRYYPGQSIVSVEKNFVRSEFDVRLANGVDIEFNGKGKVRDIEAPNGTVLPDAVVKALLPDKAYKHLADNGLKGYVEEISIGRGGYEVGLLIENPDEVVYDVVGEFVAFDD